MTIVCDCGQVISFDKPIGAQIEVLLCGCCKKKLKRKMVKKIGYRFVMSEEIVIPFEDEGPSLFDKKIEECLDEGIKKISGSLYKGESMTIENKGKSATIEGSKELPE